MANQWFSLKILLLFILSEAEAGSNSDATITLDAANYVVSEGATLAFQVCKSTGNKAGGYDIEISVEHQSTDSDDLPSLSDPAFTVTMSGNSASCTDLTLNILDDGDAEPDEMFLLEITDFDGGEEGDPIEAEVLISANGDTGGGCDHTNCFTSDGTFTSANYPSDYESSTDDSWLITAQSGQTITINFVDFETEYSSSCLWDFVVIYDGDSTSDTEIGTYCSTTSPGCLDTTTNNALITFETDYGAEERGFSVEFFLGSSCASVCPNTDCFETPDSFTSPNYPSDYTGDLNLSWLITAPTGRIVTIAFSSDFRTESSSSCSYDYVVIYDGTSTSDTEVGTYCGTTGPGCQTSSSNNMLVTFTTDGSSNYDGFSATFNFEGYCGSVTYLNSSSGETSGTITSPNYPSNYDDDMDVYWLITADPGDLVMVVTHYQNINLPSGVQCGAGDYLKYYDGDATTDTLLETACSIDIEKVGVTSTTEKMLLEFHSDASNNAKGFFLRYYLKPNLCTDDDYVVGCREYFLAGDTTDGYKCIESGGRIVQVYCEFSTILNAAVTRLVHDQPSNITVDGSEYEDQKSWTVEFAYGNYTSPWAVKDSMKIQLYCWQYLAYDCYQSIMWSGNSEYASWRGPQGPTLTTLYYWSGAGIDESGKNCMCGEYGMCTSGSSGKCHCDADDDVWQRDAGYLATKWKLPISRILFGDVEDDDEMGSAEVGDMRCAQPILDKTSLPETCADALNFNYTVDGYYLLDIDGADTGENPFVVYCDFTTLENGVITRIGHDLEDEMYINGYHSSKPFTRTISYEHGSRYSQIKAIVSSSIGCVQLQSYDCKGASARTGDDLYFHSYENDGEIKYNFGGGQSDSCPCNDLNSCLDPSEPCNCDADLSNASPWRQDKGWYNDRDVLPIVQYNVGDTEDYREVYLNIGKLECYQNTSEIYPNCYEYKEAGMSTDGNYLVEPGDEDPFPVYCDLDYNATHVLMQLSHDAENRTHVSGYEDAGYYQQMVTYDRMSYPQLQSLFDFEADDYHMVCYQDIKYECRNSALLADGTAWALDRNGDILTSWGDAGDGMCPCAAEGTCLDGGNCNCDAKSGSWAEDAGTLSDDWATFLPITQMRLGDTADGSGEGYHTIGKLNCYISKGKMGNHSR